MASERSTSCTATTVSTWSWSTRRRAGTRSTSSRHRGAHRDSSTTGVQAADAATQGGLKVLTAASQPVLRAIGKVVGSDVLADSVAFFQAFAGMETGFRDRADDVIALLTTRRHSFVLVTGPHDTHHEAVWFADQLHQQGFGVTAPSSTGPIPASVGHRRRRARLLSPRRADEVRRRAVAQPGRAPHARRVGAGALVPLSDRVGDESLVECAAARPTSTTSTP
jgi:hypothetical protein